MAIDGIVAPSPLSAAVLPWPVQNPVGLRGTGREGIPLKHFYFHDPGNQFRRQDLGASQPLGEWRSSRLECDAPSDLWAETDWDVAGTSTATAFGWTICRETDMGVAGGGWVGVLQLSLPVRPRPQVLMTPWEKFLQILGVPLVVGNQGWILNVAASGHTDTKLTYAAICNILPCAKPPNTYASKNLFSPLAGSAPERKALKEFVPPPASLVGVTPS